MIFFLFIILLELKEKFVYGNYVYFGEFPIPISLNQQEKEKCKNPKLKSAGKFFVTRSMSDDEPRFDAVIKKDDIQEMSYVVSEGRGICDEVWTDPNYQGCGLAKYVTATCFQDVGVLGTDRIGVDISKDSHWKYSTSQRADASKYCQTITFLQCKPYNGAPDAVCVSYLRAASISEFDLVFTTFPSSKTSKSLNVFKLGTNLENEFKNNAKTFLQKNGPVWFFCKCKEDEKSNCVKMIK